MNAEPGLRLRSRGVGMGNQDGKVKFDYSQNDKLAWPQGQRRPQDEADDEACKGAEVAGSEDQYPIPLTH